MDFLLYYILLVLKDWRSRWQPPGAMDLLPAAAGGGDSGFASSLWMAFAAEDEGRTEDPTQRRKEKEREKGRVPKSPEIPSSLVTLGTITVLFFLAGWFFSNLGRIMTRYLGNFNNLPDIEQATLIPLFLSLVREAGTLLAPLFLVATIMALAGNFAQVGFLFSLKPLAMDFSRMKLDPASIIKKVFFSRQIAVNLIKTLLKVTIIGVISYFIIANELMAVMKLGEMGVGAALGEIGGLSFRLSLICTIVMLLLAVPDYFYQRFEFIESLKMTKEEVKQEMKETEGDPLVKQRQRRRAVEFMRRNMFRQVPRADVVITNPTHFAVALRFDPSLEAGPRVMAKGEDNLALMIRNLAKRHEIPIIENKPLARELYASVAEGDVVPETFYQALLGIFAGIEKIRERMARQRAS